MRCPWPAHVKQFLQEDGVILCRFEQSLAVAGVNCGLMACEKPRSDPCARCSEREDRRKAAAVGDPTRGNHGDGGYCVDNGRNERQGGNRAAAMASCFPSLCNNDVHAACHGSARSLSRADRVQDDRICGLGARNERRGIAPEERDDGNASSRQTARRSSCGNSKLRLTPNGRRVSERVSRICPRTVSRSARQSTNMPSPPALLTAAAMAGPTAPPIGA